MLEHGVYTLLLDAYYDREQAPTRAEAMRQARARTPEEVAAVEAVLADFFTEVNGRFVQSRAEEEFVKAEQVAIRNAEKGKLGGRPRKPKGKLQESRQLSEQKPDESPEKPNPLIHQSTTKAISPNGDTSAAPAADPLPTDNCPQSEIVALYHEVLPALQRVREWTPERQKLLRTRWREKPERQSLDWWREFFGYVAASDFLMGRAPGRNGPPFEADLEWLVRPKNFVKVIEGKYENR